MKSKPQNRRSFLLAGVGGTGAAVAAVALHGKPEAAAEAAVAPTEQRDGYRETEHIQKYYKTTEV